MPLICAFLLSRRHVGRRVAATPGAGNGASEIRPRAARPCLDTLPPGYIYLVGRRRRAAANVSRASCPVGIPVQPLARRRGR